MTQVKKSKQEIRNNERLLLGNAQSDARYPGHILEIDEVELDNELTESESGEKSSVLHRTCGRVRDQKIQKIIYEGTECICGRLVTKEILQERIDPERKEFIILRYERRKHEITVEHTVCGKKFQIDLPRFEKNPFCRCCRPKKYSGEKFAENIRQLTGDAYEVTVPFRGQNEKVELRHKACGTTTRGFPTEFLRGRYSKEIVEQALEDATRGKYQLIERVDDFLLIRMPDGEVKKKTVSYIMQELIRPTPSGLFTEREKAIPEFISTKGKLFAEIRERSEKYGVWFLEDRKEDGKERGIFKGYLHKLLVQGYIFLKAKGIYSVYENMEDCVVIEQKIFASWRAGHWSLVWGIAGIQMRNYDIKTDSRTYSLKQSECVAVGESKGWEYGRI